MTELVEQPNPAIEAAVMLALGYHPRVVCIEWGHRPMPIVANAEREIAWCQRCGMVLQRELDRPPTEPANMPPPRVASSSRGKRPTGSSRARRTGDATAGSDRKSLREAPCGDPE